MEYTFKLEANDFVQYQLFTASKSKRIANKKMYGWLIFTFASTVFAIYCFINDSTSLAIYFGLIAVIWGTFYPKYFTWKYYNHYNKHVNEHYKNRFGKSTTLKITQDYIFATDETGEGKIKTSEIVNVNETSQHLFITFLSGTSLIIPKGELKNVDELKNSMSKIGLTICNELTWSWK